MANYPMTGFHFSVELEEGKTASFAEVTGLNMTTTAIEYRTGEDQTFATMKMPGLKKYGNITLKRGTMSGDVSLFEWFKSINNNTVTRKDIKINLLNEEHKAVVTWNVKGAFPVKYDGGSLNASKGEVLIESVELTCESFEVVPGDGVKAS